MAWRKLDDIDPSSRLFRGQTYLTRPGLPQSISTIPHGYPSLLSALNLMRRAESDPLHALIPIFAHAAFSEVAFLNLVDELMEKLTEPLPLDNFQSENFESLQHFEVILERHAAQIRQSTRSIQILNENSLFPSLKNVSPSPGGRNSRSPSSYQGPVGNKSAQSSYIPNQQTSFSATGILQDYEDLLERCLVLLSRVNSAKNSEMNRAMILESRRAIEQSERMKKLTFLATYFIPLSFTASLFGMNFKIFGQGDLAVWWYMVFAVPFMLLTHMLSSYDPRNFFSGYRRLRRFLR
ncbi:hypothetical protein N7528_002207 [Penicillium herquei]|nr:hypothetical protein N7528_002207 [Penicillium herquei]